MRGTGEGRVRRGARRGPAGFTLVELLAVLLIIGVVAAVAVPLAAPRPATGAAATEQDLAGMLATARREAVARGATTTLHLELATGTFVLLAYGSTWMPPDTVRVGALRLPAGVALSGGRQGWARADFDPLGRAHGDRVLISAAGEPRERLLDPGIAARPPR